MPSSSLTARMVLAVAPILTYHISAFVSARYIPSESKKTCVVLAVLLIVPLYTVPFDNRMLAVKTFPSNEVPLGITCRIYPIELPDGVMVIPLAPRLTVAVPLYWMVVHLSIQYWELPVRVTEL